MLFSGAKGTMTPDKSLERTRGRIKCQAQIAAAAALSSTVGHQYQPFEVTK